MRILALPETRERLVNKGAAVIASTPQEFAAFLKKKMATYHITVVQIPAEDNHTGVIVDGVKQKNSAVALVDDRLEHAVEVRIHGNAQN